MDDYTNTDTERLDDWLSTEQATARRGGEKEGRKDRQCKHRTTDAVEERKSEAKGGRDKDRETQ